jgi:hypothetical protein
VNFNTLDTISHLGAATSDYFRNGFKGNRGNSQELQKAGGKNKNRTFAKKSG